MESGAATERAFWEFFEANRVAASSLGLLALFLSACVAHVPLVGPAQEAKARQFSPSPGTAGIYLFRDTLVCQPARLAVTLDGRPAGDTAKWTFFYWELAPGKHTLETVGWEAPLEILTETGRLYFVRQVVFLGGAFDCNSRLVIIDEKEGKEAVSKCRLIAARAGS